MSGETLKPCPFDAWPAKRIRDSENSARPFMVACTNVACGAETQHHATESEADREWNRRVTPTGFEVVPEGTMDAIAKALACFDVLTRHRATQKDKETT